MTGETPTQREQRRASCYEALTTGLDEKLLRGGGGDAIRYLETAYARSRASDPLSWPLPAVSAHRLDYLLHFQRLILIDND